MNIIPETKQNDNKTSPSDSPAMLEFNLLEFTDLMSKMINLKGIIAKHWREQNKTSLKWNKMS